MAESSPVKAASYCALDCLGSPHPAEKGIDHEIDDEVDQ